MNIKANKQKKDLIIKMIKELAELQSKVPEYAADKLDYLLKGFLNESLEFEIAIRYIEVNIQKSKTAPMKIFWIQVINLVKKYFEEAKKIQKAK